MINQDTKNKIIAFVQNQPIELVYLFGSQTTDAAGPASDYDFAILFSENLDAGGRFDLRLKLISFFCGLLKTDRVDVIDLNSAPLRFKYEAVKRRGEIFVRSKNVMSDFESKTSVEFIDYLPYIKEYTKAGIKDIAERGFN